LALVSAVSAKFKASCVHMDLPPHLDACQTGMERQFSVPKQKDLGDEIRTLKSVLKAQGMSPAEANAHEDVQKLRAELGELFQQTNASGSTDAGNLTGSPPALQAASPPMETNLALTCGKLQCTKPPSGTSPYCSLDCLVEVGQACGLLQDWLHGVQIPTDKAIEYAQILVQDGYYNDEHFDEYIVDQAMVDTLVNCLKRAHVPLNHCQMVVRGIGNGKWQGPSEYEGLPDIPKLRPARSNEGPSSVLSAFGSASPIPSMDDCDDFSMDTEIVYYVRADSHLQSMFASRSLLVKEFIQQVKGAFHGQLEVLQYLGEQGAPIDLLLRENLEKPLTSLVPPDSEIICSHSVEGVSSEDRAALARKALQRLTGKTVPAELLIRALQQQPGTGYPNADNPDVAVPNLEAVGGRRGLALLKQAFGCGELGCLGCGQNKADIFLVAECAKDIDLDVEEEAPSAERIEAAEAVAGHVSSILRHWIFLFPAQTEDSGPETVAIAVQKGWKTIKDGGSQDDLNKVIQHERVNQLAGAGRDYSVEEVAGALNKAVEYEYDRWMLDKRASIGFGQMEFSKKTKEDVEYRIRQAVVVLARYQTKSLVLGYSLKDCASRLEHIEAVRERWRVGFSKDLFSGEKKIQDAKKAEEWTSMSPRAKAAAKAKALEAKAVDRVPEERDDGNTYFLSGDGVPDQMVVRGPDNLSNDDLKARVAKALKWLVGETKVTRNTINRCKIHVTRLVPIRGEMKVAIRTLDRQSQPIKEACFGILIKALGNIVLNPKEVKYRTLKCTNKVWQEKVFNIPGGMDLLKAAGFQEKVVPEGKQLTLKDSQGATDAMIMLLAHVRAALMKYLKGKITELEEVETRTTSEVLSGKQELGAEIGRRFKLCNFSANIVDKIEDAVNSIADCDTVQLVITALWAVIGGFAEQMVHNNRVFSEPELLYYAPGEEEESVGAIPSGGVVWLVRDEGTGPWAQVLQNEGSTAHARRQRLCGDGLFCNLFEPRTLLSPGVSAVSQTSEKPDTVSSDGASADRGDEVAIKLELFLQLHKQLRQKYKILKNATAEWETAQAAYLKMYKSNPTAEALAIVAQQLLTTTEQREGLIAEASCMQNDLKDLLSTLRQLGISPESLVAGPASVENSSSTSSRDAVANHVPIVVDLMRTASVPHRQFENHATCWLACIFQSLWHSQVFRYAFETHYITSVQGVRIAGLAPVVEDGTSVEEWLDNVGLHRYHQVLKDKLGFDSNVEDFRLMSVEENDDVQSELKKYLEESEAQEVACAINGLRKKSQPFETPLLKAFRGTWEQYDKNSKVSPVQLANAFVPEGISGFGDAAEALGKLEGSFSGCSNPVAKLIGNGIIPCVPVQVMLQQPPPKPEHAWESIENTNQRYAPLIAVDINPPQEEFLDAGTCELLASVWIPAFPQLSSYPDLGRKHRVVAIICVIKDPRHYVVFCRRQQDPSRCILFNDLPETLIETLSGVPKHMLWAEVPGICYKHSLQPRLVLYESVDNVRRSLRDALHERPDACVQM